MDRENRRKVVDQLLENKNAMQIIWNKICIELKKEWKNKVMSSIIGNLNL